MSMKRTLLALVLFATLVSAASAQEAYLRNDTAATLYVLASPASDDPSAARLAPGAAYRQVPVGGVLPVRPTGAIAGFAFTRGEFQFPTFHVSRAERVSGARASGSGRQYLTVSEESLTTERVVLSAEFTELLSGPRIDNQYLDWVARDARVARGPSRAPLGVYADFGDGREATGLDESLLWGRGGTDLQWIKTDAGPADLFFAATVYTEFASSTAIFVYVYARGETIPRATLEFAPDGPEGFVLLWTPGSREPAVAGNLVSNDFFLEAQIWRSALEEAVGSDYSSLVVEISTASSAAGIWEEFVLARDDFQAVFAE